MIYYYLDEAIPVYALLAYAKTAKTDMTPDERRTTAGAQTGGIGKCSRKEKSESGEANDSAALE